MKDNEIAASVEKLVMNATGYEQDEVSAAREMAIDYYFNRPRQDDVQGRSRAQSSDLSAMTDAVLSQMLTAFTTDNVVEFEADSADDEPQTQLESDVVSHFVMNANPGYIAFQESIKDCLLLRNGVNKVWVDDRSYTDTKTYTNVDPVAFEELTNRPGVKCDVLKYDTKAKTLKLRCTYIDRDLRVESVPIEQFLYTKNWHKLELQDIPLAGERKYSTRSELVELGFPKDTVKDLPAYRADRPENNVRNPQKVGDNSNQPDPALDVIEWYDTYVLLDTDGDGVAERRRIAISNRKLLLNEETDFVPYAVGAAILNPHRMLGISLFDKLKQVQDISTGLTRALLDNANACNKSRLIVVDGKVNSDDVNDGRVNGIVRAKDSVENVKPLVTPDISQGILQNLDYFARKRSEMGGAALDLASGQAQLGSAQIGSQGLDRAYSVMEQLAAMMTKNIAETLIRQTYLLTHMTLRKYFDQPVNLKQGGKWQSAKPSDWKPRVRLNVKVGMSAGERARKVQALTFILQTQLMLQQQGAGGVSVNLQNLHNALIDWGRASELDNPEKYWMDPDSDESKAGYQANQQKAAMQQQQQQALTQIALSLEQMKVNMEKYKADQETQFKYWSESLKAEIAQAQIVGKVTGELVKAKLEPEKVNGPTEKQN